MAISKAQYESFSDFFSHPSRDRLRDLLRANIGEADYLDFKQAWPESTKLAKHILAVANSGGGAIVVGVSQQANGALVSSGLAKLADKANIIRPMSTYLPKELEYQILDFSYTASEYPVLVGRCFQVLLVEDSVGALPFLALRDGDGIRCNAVYVRCGTSSTEASHDQLQILINRRIETGHSTRPVMDLERNLEQLRALDEARERNDSFISEISRRESMLTDRESSDFKDFVEEAYEAKKHQVWELLGL
ncbi:AlbA family DNA-binding domain-containing protein [Xanthomonas arboricola]|uniref:AlbA family DNA-binding domain-containing protein n=1 Tax=Xanthomonas arboricola TaxID=56448 RepID=UPI0016223523|nr:ATP-binding protein [Xanthomonas arboricola]MBB4598918.1 putative HTH transcriptional regulator [Xanthomonas arboricola]